MTLPGYKSLNGLNAKARAAIPGFLNGLRNHGIDRPIKSKWIERALGLRGTDVRAIVSLLRELRAPIGSSEKGYWWEANESELRDARNHIEARMIRLNTVHNGLINANFNWQPPAGLTR